MRCRVSSGRELANLEFRGPFGLVASISSELFFDSRNRLFHAALSQLIRSENLHRILDDNVTDRSLPAAVLAVLKDQGEVEPLNWEYWEHIPSAYPAGTLDECRSRVAELGELYARRMLIQDTEKTAALIEERAALRSVAKHLEHTLVKFHRITDRIEQLQDLKHICVHASESNGITGTATRSQITHATT